MTMVTRWNPFREFDDLFRAGLTATADQATWLPAVDILETAQDFQLRLEIPAVAAADVKVSVDENVLTVGGERQIETPEEAKYHRREHRVGRFSRSFRLPDTVDSENITATAKDGVLTLSIAKKEQPSPRQIEVKVH